MPAEIALSVEGPSSPLLEKAAELFRRRVRERTGLEPLSAASASGSAAGRASAGATRLTLALDPALPPESFRIADAPGGGVRVSGGDGRGVIYGLGKLLRTSRLEPARIALSPWRGSDAPRRPIRGIYFATHFMNWYHVAPLDQVQRYIEELALWGCNTLAVWYDMHHFSGIDDPAARAMIDRLKALLRTANAVGIGASLTTLANEAYDTSPPELRAVPFPWHYHREICPSKPGGMELILRCRREMLQAFADVEVASVWIWPYDQGGCKCDACAPWGINGFLRCGREVAGLVREIMPAAKTLLSTWCFDYWDKREWPGLSEAFRNRPDWVDYLIVDSHGDFPEHPLKHGSPGGLPMLNFPEISMFDMGPWGGFGANPAPARFQKIWDASGSRLMGGFPYSEGIYEDMNKAVNLQHYWGDRPALETLREYAAGEFSPDVADDVVKLIQALESSHHHVAPLELKPEHGRLDAQGRVVDAIEPLYKLKPNPAAAQTLAAAEAIDARLPEPARSSWRWRILLLRATLDAELARSGGLATDQTEACFGELTRLYCADQATWAVSPPSLQAIARIKGKVW